MSLTNLLMPPTQLRDAATDRPQNLITACLTIEHDIVCTTNDQHTRRPNDSRSGRAARLTMYKRCSNTLKIALERDPYAFQLR